LDRDPKTGRGRGARNQLGAQFLSPPIDWILHGKRIYSFRDISIPPFRDVIEGGSEDSIDTRQWVDSDGEVTRRLFVQLLNRTLGDMVHEPLAFWRDRRYLFWKLGRGHQTRTFRYRSFENQTSRKVVKAYKREGETKPSYFRHDAFHPNLLNRSTDGGQTWTRNGSAAGIVVANADSTQPQPKFCTVNALLGGVEHAAVDPKSGAVVWGSRMQHA
jgi:hypothetical protein